MRTKPTRPQLESWYEQVLETPYACVLEINGRAVGEAAFTPTVRMTAVANLAIGIDDPALLGRGYGTEAIKLLLAQASDTMPLDRIGVRVLEYNARALRGYNKCRFVVEGREREATRVADRWYDDINVERSARE